MNNKKIKAFVKCNKNKNFSGFLKKNYCAGFTLVELIVVITILSILGAIAFISLQGYSQDARDSARMSDISNIKTSLELFQLDSGKYPTPTQGVDITYSGGVVWSQGIFGNSVFDNIQKLDKLPEDPLTNSNYTYSTTKTRKEYEIAGILESDIALNLLDKTYAGDTKAVAMVTGNYNGQISRILSGTTCNILSVPTIIASDIVTSTDIVEITNNKRFVYDGFNNLPSSYRISKFNIDGGFNFTPNKLLVYSDNLSCTPLFDTSDSIARSKLIRNLQLSYSGTILKDSGGIRQLFDLDTSNQKDINLLGISLINNSLGSKIPITESTLNIPSCVDTQNPTDEIYFTFDSSTNTITDYNIAGGTDVVIPCTINGKSVTNIGEQAFLSKSLTSIVIPESVTDIQKSAFRNNSLTFVRIPSKIKSIGVLAFSLNSITNVKNYDGIDSNNYIYIPYEDGLKLVHYIGTSTSINIPEVINGKNVIAIGERSFVNAGITSITLPNTITDIGIYAFNNNSLTTVTIPSNIKNIGEGVFKNNSLTSITNYDGYTSTGYLYIPSSNGIEIDYYIGTETNLTIPSSINGKTVVSIGDMAFYNIGLTNVVIPNTVTYIGAQAFNRNPFVNVTNYDGNISTEYIYMLKGSGIEIVDYIGTASNLTIPSNINGKNVISIGDSAFYYSRDVTSVVIPNTIISIGEMAFGDGSLVSVTIPSSVTFIGDRAFYYQVASVGSGTVYGPASGYIYDTYLNSDSSALIGEFDKTKLTNYIPQ